MKGLCVALALLGAGAAAPELDVSLSSTELTVGETTSRPASRCVSTRRPRWARWAGPNGSVPSVRPRSSKPRRSRRTRLGDGRRELTQTLRLIFFEVGEATLPAVAVEIATADGSRTATSEPSDPRRRGLRPPRRRGGARVQATGATPTPRPRRAVLVVVRSAGCHLPGRLGAPRRAREGGRADATVPTLSPREELDRTLADLRAESDATSLHAGLSLGARRFLGRSLGFPAAESTTSEVRASSASDTSRPISCVGATTSCGSATW